MFQEVSKEISGMKWVNALKYKVSKETEKKLWKAAVFRHYNFFQLEIRKKTSVIELVFKYYIRQFILINL